jgi:hypothetical protein
MMLQAVGNLFSGSGRKDKRGQVFGNTYLHDRKMNKSMDFFRRMSPPLMATTMTALVAGLLWLFIRPLDGSFWEGMALGNAGLRPEYCEFNHMEDFIRQPVNSWSNFCYLFLGIWLLTWGIQDGIRREQANPIQRFPAMTIWIGLMQVGLCFGSFFFHASLTRLGQHWDMTFTYGLGLSLAFGAAYRLGISFGMQENIRSKAVFLSLAIATTILFFFIKWWLNGRVALPIVMLLGVVLAVVVYVRQRKQLNGWTLLLGLMALILAAVFRSLDLAKVGCEPQGLLQFHALWHLATGVSAMIFLAFLRNEKP